MVFRADAAMTRAQTRGAGLLPHPVKKKGVLLDSGKRPVTLLNPSTLLDWHEVM